MPGKKKIANTQKTATTASADAIQSELIPSINDYTADETAINTRAHEGNAGFPFLGFLVSLFAFCWRTRSLSINEPCGA